MISMARSLFVLLLTASLAVMACGGSDDEAPAAAGETPSAVPTTESKPATGTISSKHNPELKGALPTNFPDDVPIHPGADVVFSRASSDMAMSVRLLTDDDAGDVASALSDDFAAKGWATQKTDTPDGTLIVADKLSRKAAATVTTSEDGRTQIDLLVTSLPK